MKETFWNKLGLHPENYQGWEHCRIDEWLVDLMLTGGTNTTIFYVIFSALLIVGYHWKVGRGIFVKWWWIWLSIVFIYCGLIHFAHVWAKVFPKLYLVTLNYPLLNVAMLGVLYTTIISIKNKWTKLKTAEQVEEIVQKTSADLADIILDAISKSDGKEASIELEKVRDMLLYKGYSKQSKQVDKIIKSI